MRRRDLFSSALALPLIGTSPARAQAVRQRPLDFPADFGAHPAARIEWWYLTGELQAADRRYGFQVTFFRSRTEVAADHPSRFAATQVLSAHAALSDLTEHRLRHDQRLARTGFGVARAAEGDTDLRLRDWSLRREGPAASTRYLARVHSETAHFGVDLQFDATQPPLLQGIAGFSRKGPPGAQASHYYSRPHLRASGRLTLDGREQPATGRAWLDHEWSDQVLAPETVGWDWIGMQLDDGGALTAFRVRRADGSTYYAGGSFRPAGGSVRAFEAAEVTFTPLRTWVSPASNARYPVEWAVETPAGRFRIAALFDAQELDSRASTGAFYWEGLSALRADDDRPLGSGYLEMTGYAQRLIL